MAKIQLWVIFGLAFLINLSLVSGIPNIGHDEDNSFIGTVKAGNCMQLSALCANCTYVNVSSVLLPNKTVVNLNRQMGQGSPTYFNLTFCMNADGGMYNYGTFGNLNGIVDSASGDYRSTQSGTELTISESILYVVLIIINMALFLTFLILAIKLPYNDEVDKNGTVTRVTKAKYLKLLCILLTYGTFLWFLAIFTGIINNFISLEVYRTMITSVYMLAIGLGWIVTLAISIIIFVELWKDLLKSLLTTFLAFMSTIFGGRNQ